MQILTNSLLAVIAALLCAILLKLNEPQRMVTTRGDLMALRAISDPAAKRERARELMDLTPVTWIEGGSIEVSGGYITVDGEVSVYR